MQAHPVLIAVTGAWEAPLVASVESARGSVSVIRRCADLADLLSVAAGGRARAALVSADLRGLDRDAVARLRHGGVAVVGVATPGLSEHVEHLLALGVADVLPADADPGEVERVVTAAVSAGSAPSVASPADPALTVDTARWSPAEAARSGAGPASADGTGRGRVVAVWGPVGSPGRTTVAVTLAAELAALGESALLVDADTYGASIGQALGVLDEAPGLAAVCRAASTGSLDREMLARLAPTVSPGLRVLTGITRADRWPELSVSALEVVWEMSRSVADWTVVDTGFCLERDEELSYDTRAPRRNGATLSALESAEVVVAVGSADPVGLQRLVRGLGELSDVLGTVTPRVVVTRSRAGAVGTSPDRRVRDALQRYAGVPAVTVVPDDRAALDSAMLAGRSLTEQQPYSLARQVLTELALDLSGRTSGRRRRARRAAGGAAQ